jgi:hypothetical protein
VYQSGRYRDLESGSPWWSLGFDGKALVEAVIGCVVVLIALFSSCDHINLLWRRNPAREIRLKKLVKRSRRLENDLALLDWMHSGLDL